MYNYIITISTLTTTESAGHASESWGTPVSIRADVKQVDGVRKLQDTELKDRVVYEIRCFDNGYSDNIKIGYNGVTLYPVRPITKNRGENTFCSECVIYASARR